MVSVNRQIQNDKNIISSEPFALTQASKAGEKGKASPYAEKVARSFIADLSKFNPSDRKKFQDKRMSWAKGFVALPNTSENLNLKRDVYKNLKLIAASGEYSPEMKKGAQAALNLLKRLGFNESLLQPSKRRSSPAPLLVPSAPPPIGNTQGTSVRVWKGK